MKHLVIAVSPDSSLELLRTFADVIVLDKELVPKNLARYDTLYIRSHFGQLSTLPQNYRAEINNLVQRLKQTNSNIKFIDDADSVDKILAFEDKWLQYKTFGDVMPNTQLLDDSLNIVNFNKPIFKKRLSSRGTGITWDVALVTQPAEDWIAQESIGIAEELRVYIIRGNVYPVGAVRRSMTSEHKTEAVSSRELTQEEIDFAVRISNQNSVMDFVGLDIARAKDGQLHLMEVNRSPGFAAFEKLSGVNLASILYS
ncbi:MAG: hypothetical protein V4611_02565 [Patescibacteria group bacterium]